MRADITEWCGLSEDARIAARPDWVIATTLLSAAFFGAQSHVYDRLSAGHDRQNLGYDV